jgi:hypothetical protein
MEEGANRDKVCWQIYHPDRGQNFHRPGIRLRFPGDDGQVVIRPSDRAHYSFYGDTLVSDRFVVSIIENSHELDWRYPISQNWDFLFATRATQELN